MTRSTLAAPPESDSVAPDTVTEEGDKRAQAISHFQAAVKLVEAGSYEEAASELERSVAIYPSKSALFNLGNSYQALHRYVDALAVFTRLDREFGDSLKPEMRAALDEQLAEVQALVVHLRVEAEPQGAELSLNGTPFVATRQGRMLDPGTYMVRAALDGYNSAEQRVVLSPGETKTISFDLEEAIGRVEIRVSVPGATVYLDDVQVGISPLDGPLGISPGQHDLRIECEDHHTYERSFEVDGEQALRLSIDLESDQVPVVVYERPQLKAGFWVAVGGTVLATGASVTGFAIAGSKDAQLQSGVADYESLPPNTSQVTLDAQYDELDDIQSQRDTAAAIGWVGAGLAVAGAVTAVALGWDYFFGKAPAGAEQAPVATRRTKITLYPTAHGIGGRF